MANINNVRAIQIADELYDIYETAHNFTIFNYIGQVHANQFIGEVVDAEKGQEKVLELVADRLFRDLHKKYCINLIYGKSE